MAQFGGQIVRVLYGLLGLAGCAMLIAGSAVWLRKREARQSKGLSVVRALNGAVYFGLPIASLVLLWANRLLPDDMPSRAATEAWCFALSWVAVAAFAVLRASHPTQLQRQLFCLMAVLALGLPALGGLFTPNGHVLASLGRGDAALAGIDLVLLGTGVLCAWRACARPAEQRLRAARRVQEVSP